jgi:hypothetical protein
MTHRPDETIAKNDGIRYAPHPEGPHTAVCVDCLNLGERVESFNGKTRITPKLALVFRSAERREDGDPFEISAEFTCSMHERAGLRKFLEAWRGKPYTDEEARAGVPVHKMAGVPALISVTHVTSNQGRSYAKIGSIMRLPKGLEPPDTGEYQRADYWADRKSEYAEAVIRQRALVAPSHDDLPDSLPDDLPF